jgi:heme a synthase
MALDVGDPPGRVAAAVQGARDLSAADFKRKLARVVAPFVLAIAANGAINASGLSRNARAIVSAPFGLLATLFGLAAGFLMIGRYVRIGVHKFRIAAAISAVLLAFIVFTGSFVRLTGSGLGCPDWPDCKGGDVIPKSGRSAQIEFGNRVITGLCVLAAAVCVLLAFVRVPYRRDLVKYGVIVSVLIFGNAIVGAFVVIFHLKTGTVTLHFALALVSIAVGLLLFHRSGEPGASADLLGRGRVALSPSLLLASRITTTLTVVGLLLGAVVTGTGPHVGDPAKTERYPFELKSAAIVHSGVMWLVLASVVVLAVISSRTAGAEKVRSRVNWLMAALVAQGGVGYLQWAKHLPAWLVQIHVVGAVMVWTLVLWVRAAVTRPAAVSLADDRARTLLRRLRLLQRGGPAN